jgi:hypothetical protein
MPPDPASASVSVDRVANAFIAWAESSPGTYWWWPRDIRLDPDEVIADDGEGGTYRVPFTTDGEIDVTFGEAVEVRETFVDVAAPAAAAAAASARVKQRVLARDLPKPNKPDPSNPAASAATTEEDDRVPIDIPALRSRLQLSEEQLPDDATEEQINAALASDPTPPPGDPESPGPVPGDPVSDPATPADPSAPANPADPTQPSSPPAPEPVTDPVAATQARALQETTERLATLEAQAAQRAETERRERRDGLASTWVREGRIAPAERDHYRGLLDIDEDRTVALAAQMSPGRVPVAERGTDTPAASGGITHTGWFPQLTQEA